MASFSVVNNISAQNAQANLSSTQVKLTTTLSRLSSGLRINKSGDDAAGLAVANTYRSKVAVLNQGIMNANDGLSQLQIKDGALGNISTLLDRLGTLAAQAASGATDVDRTKLDTEFADVVTEITREATVAGLASASSGFSVFVSSESTASDGKITQSSIGRADATGLSITGQSLTTTTGAATAVTAVTNAVSALGAVQAKVGSLQNRLQFAVSLAQSQVVNVSA